MARIVFAFFLLCGFLTSMAFAAAPIRPFQGGEFAPPPMSLHAQSGQEGILLSFYRNSGRAPDFKRWSQATENTLKAAPYDRRVVALNEQVRLQTAFENTDPSGFLVIHAPIDVSQYSETQEILFIPAFGHGGTLAQEIYGEKIAMIIPELAQFQALAMTNAEAGGFYRPLTQGGRKRTIGVPVVAEMIVKPRRTVLTKEGRVGKNDHYLFFLDLAQLTIWKSENDAQRSDALWTWRADWYTPESENDDLLQLYKAIN